jgi:RNA polymerase sigma-70 factor, ECF subfamily
MLAWAGGDAGAFEQLYRRHKDSLYRYFLRHVRPPDLAGEAFQDVWQKVIQSRDRYRADAPFAAWLYTLAHHRLMDHYRSQRPNDEMPDDLAAPERDHPERRAEQSQQSYRLLAALQTLPPEQREILVLREEQDFTLEQIAAIQGVGRETVKSRLRYALAKLREVLND